MLSEIAPDLWVTEAPLRYGGVEMGRRMAVVRLADGRLWIHSPVALTGELKRELDAVGPVRFVVPASSLHGHLWMEQYQGAYPDARLFAAAGLRRKRPDLSFADDLHPDAQPDWAQDLDQTLFEGHRVLVEVEFLHRSTRTLICGDMCFNIGSGWPLTTRLLAWGPRMRPRLGPTVAFRIGLRRAAARRSIERILRWDFDRILPGHGEIIDAGGREAFRNGFAWLLR